MDLSKLIFIDFETTGFKKNAPVSLAYLAYQDQKLIGKDYIIINPEEIIEEGAYKVHGISQEEAEKFPNFKEVWGDIKLYFDNSIICAHNSNYDVNKVLLPTLRRYALDFPKNFHTCDTLANARNLISSKNIKNYKLDTLCDYFNIEFHNHHTASFDTVACMRIFNKLVQLSNGNLIID